MEARYAWLTRIISTWLVSPKYTELTYVTYYDLKHSYTLINLGYKLVITKF